MDKVTQGRIVQRNRPNVTGDGKRNQTGKRDNVGNGEEANVPLITPVELIKGLRSIGSRELQRRPPKLRFGRKAGEDADEIDALVHVLKLEPLASKGTLDVAMQIAELVVRHGHDAKASGDQSVQAGMEAIELMLRMFEHIYVTQSQMAMGGGAPR